MPFDSAPVTFKATLSGLIAWLRTKDPAEEYSYSNNCLFEQFGEAVTSQLGSSAYCEVLRRINGEKSFLFGEVKEPGNIARTLPHTMGAALERATLYQKTHK